MPQPTKAGTTLLPEPVLLPPDDRPLEIPRPSAALKRQRDQLRDLKRSHQELTRRFSALQERSERARKGLRNEVAGMERRVEKAVTTQSHALRRQSRTARALAVRQRQELRAMVIKAGLDKVTAAIHTAQAAAFGQTGSLTAPNNLTLLANQIFWTFVEPVLRGLGIQTGVSPGVLDFLTPLGALLTGQVALSNDQHQRFVTGVTTFDGSSYIVSESLRGQVADSFFPKLQQRTDLPVSLTPLDPARAVFFARVHDGILSIVAMVPGHTLPDATPPIGLIGTPTVPAPKARVAWMVDLGAAIG